ncbi:MAG: 2Fe-2S iron-sulfur cluster-binding protein [Acidimicrobiia bacterium]
MNRLPPQPAEVLDRDRELSFTWNGRRMSGFAGDTIASALAANGVRVLARSFKYRRPRGLMTVDYWDPAGLVQVGAEPNVRAGHRLLTDGIEVSAQTGWPSVDRDLASVTGLVGRFLSSGFYYKTFMRPRRLWPAYENVLTRFGTRGQLGEEGQAPVHDHRYAHPDVVVAGGGPAGMAAAVAAAEAGASVMLVEHEHHLGGHLRWGDAAELDALAVLRHRVGSVESIEVLANSTVTGRYDDNWVSIVQRSHPGVEERLIKARAKMLIVAPGLIERPYVFSGNDLPGVMLSGGVRRLINLYGVKPGEKAVVLTANESGDAAIRDLTRVGVDVVEVLDGRRDQTISSAEGRRGGVSRVTDSDGRSTHADLVVTAVGWTAPTSLLNMAGDMPTYDTVAARFFSNRPPASVLVAGGLAGDGTLDQLLEHARETGELAARRAAAVRHRLQAMTARASPAPMDEPEFPTDTRSPLPHRGHPAMFRSTTHGMVDFSEDVSSKDLVGAAKEGYDSIELLKRYSTATMGPQQGKLETVNLVAVLAEALHQTLGQVGTTVWRPPYAPVTLGGLAGPRFEPKRVSALQDWHEAHGCTNILAGAWVRPEHYGDPAAEVTHVRNEVGIIDVTPLGKLDLQGPDVARLLEMVYVNKWSKLPIGGVRYGLMCNEEGVVLDDGVTGRLRENHYLMTTTSSGAAMVWEWIENWLQTGGQSWKVHVTPVTTAYVSINVAGPRSRELVARLADIDLSPDAFPYMQVRTGTVAGVRDCVMWRIGFTGELSYELHVPAGFGLHVWEQLMAVGADLDVRPFGLEAQRIMRLEKGHFIVGQDTDGLTKASALGLGKLLRLDKDDFAGKPELGWAAESPSTTDARLVAIQTDDPNVVPAEGTQIVTESGYRILGRITSSRFSPTLDRSICLGQVIGRLAEPGTRLTIQLEDGRRVPARVSEYHAHFDPDGERARG